MVALATLVLVPCLTLALWRNPLSYSRYGAPAAGLLLLFYGLRRDRWSGGLLFSVAALSLLNPVVPLLPAKHQGVVRPPPPSLQARAEGILPCLARSGLLIAQTADLATGTVKLTTTQGPMRGVAIYIFESPEVASARGKGIITLTRAAGGTGKRIAQEVIVYPKALPPAKSSQIEGCLS